MAPVFALSALAPVTWSACTWVSRIHTRRRPSARTRARSRASWPSTGSMTTASRVSSSPTMYVKVEDSVSKSWWNIIAALPMRSLEQQQHAAGEVEHAERQHDAAGPHAKRRVVHLLQHPRG